MRSTTDETLASAEASQPTSSRWPQAVELVRTQPVRTAAVAGFSLALALALSLAAYVQVASYSPVPFWDMWDELRGVQAALSGQLTIGDLWAQHNEHRILLSRIQFIADYAFFGGRLLFLLASIFASSLLLAIVLASPARSVWREQGTATGFLAACVAGVLSPAGWENLTWPFQIGFVQTYLFAVSAVAVSACRLRPETRPGGKVHWAGLGATVALAGAATYSMANGLLTWPVVIGIMLARRVGPRSTALATIAGAAFAASYLWRYHPVAGHTPYTWSVEHPLAMGRYVAAFLGHPASILGSTAEQVVGAAGVLVALALIAHAARLGRVPNGRVVLFGAGAAAFALASAIETALGRLGFGIGQALSSRYAIGAAVFWLGLLVGLAPIAAGRVRILVRAGGRAMDVTGTAFAACAVALWIAIDVASLPSATALDGIKTRGDAAVVAFMSRVDDPSATEAVFPDAATVAADLAWLRREGLGPWSGGLARTLERVPGHVASPGGLEPCRGWIDATTTLSDGRKISGWILAPPGRAGSAALDVVDRSGEQKGLGLVDVNRPDVAAAVSGAGSHVGFVAYARTGREAAFLVLFDPWLTRPLCALPLSGKA
ncbi:MAG: hypothetical protein IRZ17_16585 [Mycolicibacterium hassiacum]|uniref:hypothetical protein n=1 Tax=Mycolicibacterium hassiacum TaxID=46351 RepID=UPI0023F72BB8|nr:hypothetical protein [Mycolicibacterium hassiacum]MBX5488211.1 hypothetical protein [Mycolicibacterium hassiacum]